MRWMAAVLLVAFTVAGCAGPQGQPGGGDAASEQPTEPGRTFFRTVYLVAPGKDAEMQVVLQSGMRNVTVGLSAAESDAPVHVALSGCGEAEIPASTAAWTDVLLCAEPAAGRQTLRLSLREGTDVRSGEVLLRAHSDG